MGKRRGEAAQDAGDVIVAFRDPKLDTSSSLQAACAGDAVVVAVPTPLLAHTTLECIQAGAKRILVEKPCAMTPEELDVVLTHPQAKDVIIVPGYTLRHYPGIVAAHAGRERYGRAHHLRIIYGHGGGARGWRAQPNGGGELLDQAPHCVDLARSFLGDLGVIGASLTRQRLEHGVEDNVFLLLGGEDGVTASIHASYTEWAPRFEMTVVHERGVVTVRGLNKTYGEHRVTFHRERGLDEERVYPNPARPALAAEWKAFCETSPAQARAQMRDARSTLRLLAEARRCKSS